MPTLNDLRRALIASVLLCAAFSSAALTLGRSQGVALIGRSLDVRIALTLDTPAQAAELCPEADVFQGDSRVEPSRVSARVEPGTGQNAVVRVRSSQLVDEPVVTIYLRLGCSQKITRRYVLLSEEPGDAVSPLPPAASAAAVRPPAALALPTPASPAPSAAAPAATTATARGSANRVPGPRAPRAATADAGPAAAVARPRAAVASRGERSLPQRRAGSARDRSRLTVDMLDLLPDRDPQLRSTAALASQPAASEQVRAQAAALWRAINAQPEDVLRDLQRVQALETDVKGLRILVTGNERTLGELREQLNQSRQERTFTLAAIALLLLLLSAVAVTWWLRRGERGGYAQWWRGRDAAADGAGAGSGAASSPGGRVVDLDLHVDESMFESLKEVPRAGRRPAPAVAKASAPVAAAPPPAVAVAAATAAAETADAAPNSVFHSSFHASQAASMRMVKAEELVDIQQQADFFLSLGQTAQAIELLESHIRSNVETSALVWLDLLAIYRSLKRQDDYERLRADFQRVFNAEVPSYEATPTKSGGLEDYPRALTRIAALWPSPKVMDVIEESIFRKPGATEGEPFDLEAYRELVMLYNLGREVVLPVSVPAEEWTLNDAPGSSFFETSMQPLSASRESRQMDDVDAAPAGAGGLGKPSGYGETPFEIDDSVLGAGGSPVTTLGEFPDIQMPRPSPRLGIDIDLSADVASPPAGPDSSRVDFDVTGGRDDDAAGPGKPSKQ